MRVNEEFVKDKVKQQMKSQQLKKKMAHNNRNKDKKSMKAKQEIR